MRFVATGQMRHDAAHPHPGVGRGAAQGVEYVRVVAGADPVAAQSGVDLDRDVGGASGALHRVENTVQLAHRRHPDVHIGHQGGAEVRVRRVQPGQHRGGDAVGAQRQSIVEGRHAQFRGAGRQGGAGHLGRAVAVAVGLDHGHHRRGPGVLLEHPDVVGDGVKVDDGFAVHATVHATARQRCGLHDHDCPRLDAHAGGTSQCAKCSCVKWPSGWMASRWLITACRSSHNERARSAENPSRTTTRSTVMSCAPSGMVYAGTCQP